MEETLDWRTIGERDRVAGLVDTLQAVPTMIRFDKEHKLEVSESAGQIRQAILACGSVFAPLVCLTRTDEQKIWINGANVRELEERSGDEGPMVHVI